MNQMMLISLLLATFLIFTANAACEREVEEQAHGLCKQDGKCEKYCRDAHKTPCGGGCRFEDGKDRCYCVFDTSPGAGTYNDPHYVTFDRYYHQYQGLCKHTAVKQCRKTASFPTFHIMQQNKKYTTTFSLLQKVFFDVAEWKLNVEFDIQKWRVIDTSIKVNNKVVSLPYEQTFKGKYHGSIKIYRLNHYYHAIETSFGVKVIVHTFWWKYYVYLPKHPEIYGNTCGVLGKWDGSRTNDLTDANGKVHRYSTYYAFEFGDSWCVGTTKKTSKSEKARALKVLNNTKKACMKDTGRKRKAEHLCGPLKSSSLARCTAMGDAYDYCVTDVCASKGKSMQEDLACGAVETANELCRTNVKCAK